MVISETRKCNSFYSINMSFSYLKISLSLTFGCSTVWFLRVLPPPMLLIIFFTTSPVKVLLKSDHMVSHSWVWKMCSHSCTFAYTVVRAWEHTSLGFNRLIQSSFNIVDNYQVLLDTFNVLSKANNKKKLPSLSFHFTL